MEEHVLQNILDKYEDELQTIAEWEGAFEGVIGDNWPEAFDYWYEKTSNEDKLKMLLDYLKDKHDQHLPKNS